MTIDTQPLSDMRRKLQSTVTDLRDQYDAAIHNGTPDVAFGLTEQITDAEGALVELALSEDRLVIQARRKARDAQIADGKQKIESAVKDFRPQLTDLGKRIDDGFLALKRDVQTYRGLLKEAHNAVIAGSQMIDLTGDSPQLNAVYKYAHGLRQSSLAPRACRRLW